MIPIYKPYMPEGVEDELSRILYSGQLTSGHYLRKFEKSLNDFIGVSNNLVTNSYNSAMLIALSTIGVGPGDEVIASPVSCLASNQPIIAVGAKVVWADVNPLSGALEIEDVKSKITSKTKVIIHNHFCGYIGNVAELNEMARSNGIVVIDDAIEAFGSEFQGKKMGNLGTDVTVFSFQTVRLPNTIDGGAIIFKDDELYKKAIRVRDYGINRSTFRDAIGEINPLSDISHVGYSGLMNEINSFIGLMQMEKVEFLLEKQRANGEKWNAFISNEKDLNNLVLTENSYPNNWVYGLLAEDKPNVINNFRKKGFYATGVHINNDSYSVFGKQNELKGVKEFMNKYVALPCGWWFNLESEI